MTKARRAALKARIAEHGEAGLFEAIANLAASKFHCGDNDRGWKANLDWFLKPANLQKMLERQPDKPKVGAPSPANGALFADLQSGKITNAQFHAERARLSAANGHDPPRNAPTTAKPIGQLLPRIGQPA
jgi:hypothetical protein